jgi:hypothetical protein
MPKNLIVYLMYIDDQSRRPHLRPIPGIYIHRGTTRYPFSRDNSGCWWEGFCVVVPNYVGCEVGVFFFASSSCHGLGLDLWW